jgi:ferredoxin
MKCIIVTAKGILLLILLLSSNGANAWITPLPALKRQFTIKSSSSEQSWSVADDWNTLSEKENSGDAAMYSLIQQVDSPEMVPSADDQWLQQAVDSILLIEENSDTAKRPHLEDSESVSSFEDAMDGEIALLVRCNENPQSLLVKEGRALKALTEAERTDPSQLVEMFVGEWVATKFFDKGIDTMFRMHAAEDSNGKLVMDGRSVASWLQRSLKEVYAVGPHDQRVLGILARFSSYGTGYLALEDMKRLYLETVTGEDKCTSYEDILRQRQEFVTAVWRDLRNHGIYSPREVEHAQDKRDLSVVQTQTRASVPTVMDECELIYQKVGDRKTKSSHQQVELASDNKTPLWINDGDFVFIDEDSCIGCTNCALAAPASFEILGYDGRARTFSQRPKSQDIVSAVSTCPVDCMHYVSYEELKELETARDDGDGREDHRHFGVSEARGYVERKPLHVQRRESDANHRSSWYHYLKDKCCKSAACPERGCFDCPAYKSGSNPFFQDRVRKATHVRAQHFMETGIADEYREMTEL